MHLLSPHRLRDRFALARAEAAALLTLTALVALGLCVPLLPQPPATLSPQTIHYSQAFERASAAELEAAPAAEKGSIAVATAPQQPAAQASKSDALRLQGPVPLNTATAAQLELLPRVGPKMAQRILEYRAARGGFRSIEELGNVKGIGEKTLAQLRPLVVLG